MPVSPQTAYDLLHAFGMLEFNLKRISDFLGTEGDRGNHANLKAKVNWNAVDRAVAALPSHEFLDRIPPWTKDKMLGGDRNRPMVQYIEMAQDGNRSAYYEFSDLPGNDAEALLVAMRRVRNNLFHGGKEDPLEEARPGDDEDWALAARDVAELLLKLLKNDVLRPLPRRTAHS